MPKNKRGDVEIWTDAANRFGAGAWAAVGLRPKEPETYFEQSGSLKIESPSSVLHELQAVANGLHRAELLGLLREGDLVIVRTDCLSNIPRLNDLQISRRAKGKPANEVVVWIARLCRRKGVTLKAKHVKGHQPEASTDPYAANNRRCDKLCTAVLKRDRAAAVIVSERATARADQLRKRLDSATKLMRGAAK